MMLDISRNYTRKADLFKLIDLLAAYKLNVFHFHFSDDEGWRLEIPGLEELTSIGSRRGFTRDESQCLYPNYYGGWNPADTTVTGNGYYTRQDFIDLLQYAAPAAYHRNPRNRIAGSRPCRHRGDEGPLQPVEGFQSRASPRISALGGGRHLEICIGSGLHR